MTRTDKIIDITTDSRDYLQALYLDYLNNFISVEGFANVYELNEEQAGILINIGRRIHKQRNNV